MSYSDELPTNPGEKARGYSKDIRTADRSDHTGHPVEPPPNVPIPAPRQNSMPVQAAPPVQQAAPRQVSAAGNQNISLPQTARPQQAPPQQTRPAGVPPQQTRPPAAPQQPSRPAAVPQQPSRPAPQQVQPGIAVSRQPQVSQQVRERIVATPAVQAAPVQPQNQAPPREKQATISVGEERPKQPIDKSTLTFASGSGEKPSPKDLLLDTDGLVKIYDGRTVVNGVNINVKRGEIVGLLGPNGAGKTTSFYMMVGLVPPNGGKVIFDGQDVTKLPMYKRARLGMGYLPQEESIFRKLTVEENIMAVMQTMKYSRKEKKARCDELLERFSITHIRKNIAMTCSGGEKRRVTIARSLVPDPSLIMLDEPFGGVDPIAVNEIQNIVKDLRKAGLAVLITDHNARETLNLVDRAYLICEGRVLREGPQEFLVNDPVSRELYLGDRFSM